MTTGWTAVALSQDIPAGTAAPGHVGGNDLAIWRSASGRIAAWADRCPHRGMRLSHGFVRGEALSCIYHGWRYGQNGQCMKIPAHPDLEPPDAIRVPAFAVTEGSGVVWVAAEAPVGPPPSFPGFAGFRSLQVEAPIASVARGLGGDGAVIHARFGQTDVVALLQPLSGDRTGLHILAPEAASADALDALSVAVEGARRRIEAACEKGRAA